MKRYLFTNCTIVQGELFLIGALGGLLAKVNLENGNMSNYEMQKGFVQEKNVVLIEYMENYQDYIYALDSKGVNLVIIGLKNRECRYVSLNCAFRSYINFVSFERYRTDYYIFPKYENKLLIYHTSNEKLQEISGYLEDVNEIQCACRVKEDVWILPKASDVMFCYELSTGEKKRYKLNRVLQDCVHSVFHEGYIYILNMFGVVYRWDIEKTELLEIADLNINRDENESWSKVIYAGNRLIFLPAYGNDIKILDLYSGKINIYESYPEDFTYQSTWLKYYGYCEDENNYYFAACSGNYMLKIDKQTGKFAWMKPTIEDSIVSKRMESVKDKIYYEGIYDTVDLLNAISKNLCQPDNKFIGQKIYRWMME